MIQSRRSTKFAVVLSILIFSINAYADPVGDYQGWLWENGYINDGSFTEEYCFSQVDLDFAVDLSWSAATTDDICWGRTTTNAGRAYDNPPPFSTSVDEGTQSTQPLVSAGGNLYELYGEDIEGGIGQGEERIGALMSSQPNDNLLMLGGYDKATNPDEAFRFIDLFAKSTPSVRDNRDAADLEGTSWRIALMAHTVSEGSVNFEVIATSIFSFDFLTGGVCSASTSSVFPEFTDNGDYYRAIQFDDGINFDDRFVRTIIPSINFSSCTYTIDTNGYLALTYTETDASDPGNPVVTTDRYVVSDDNTYLVAAPATVLEENPRNLVVGYRAADQIAANAIDSTYFFHFVLSEFGADGAGAAAAGFGPRGWQEFELAGRGKLVFDSTTIGTTPAGETGTWYNCDMEMVLNEFEHEFTGSTGAVTLNVTSDESVEVAFDACDYQLDTLDGSLRVRLQVIGEEEDEGFDGIMRGYVNESGDLIALALRDFEVDPLNPGNLNKDLVNMNFILAMKYTDDPAADEDGDGFSNYQEFKIPLAPSASTNDFDGDGSGDILWRNNVSGANHMYLMDGATVASSVSVTTVPSPDDWKVAGNGDYNGDGSADILWRNAVDGQNHMYLMSGSTVLSSVSVTAVPDPDNWKVVGSGDYNGDGNSDILWRNNSTGQNHMYLMNGATVASSLSVTTVPSPLVWVVAGGGDFNGDGMSDILWRNETTGQNHMYLMNGATVASSLSVTTVPSPDLWKVAGTGDFDGDGNADILWRQSVTGQNHMYLMNGATVAGSQSVTTVSNPNDWKVTGNADYDGDGRADILWRNISTGQNHMYLMNGSTVDSSLSVTAVTDVTWEVVNAP